MNRIVRIVCVALALCAAAGCEKTSVDVAAEVKKEMQEELVKKTGLKNLVVEDVVLVKERDDGIDYTGVATGKVDGEEVKFDVTCKYDGDSLIWKADLSEGCMAVLATKEKAKEWYGKLKDGVKRSSDAVAQAVGEASESVKKVAGEATETVKKAAGEATESVKKVAGEASETVKKAAGETYDAVKNKTEELYDKAKQKISTPSEGEANNDEEKKENRK